MDDAVQILSTIAVLRHALTEGDHVFLAARDGTSAILDPTGGRSVTLSASATFIVGAVLEGAVSVEDIARDVAESFGVDAAAVEPEVTACVTEVVALLGYVARDSPEPPSSA